MKGRRLRQSPLPMNLRHTERTLRHLLIDTPITGKPGDTEAVLNTVTMFFTRVAKQHTTVPKTRNHLAYMAVFLTLNIYPTTQKTICSKYSEKH